jgi:cobalt-zinc-cadmium efflux system membrane fusion protein
MNINFSGNGNDAMAYIRAPQSGYILEKKVTEGQLVRADNSDYLFNIVSLNDVWVLANVYEADIAKVKQGMEADVTTISYPDKTFKGKVNKVSDMLDPDSRVMKVRIQLDNPEKLLRPKMFANVKLIWTEEAQKVMIASNALVMDSSKYHVVIYHTPNNLETRDVQVARELNGKAYLDWGVQPGDLVLTKQQLIIYNALKGKQ